MRASSTRLSLGTSGRSSFARLLRDGPGITHGALTGSSRVVTSLPSAPAQAMEQAAALSVHRLTWAARGRPGAVPGLPERAGRARPGLGTRDARFAV